MVTIVVKLLDHPAETEDKLVNEIVGLLEKISGETRPKIKLIRPDVETSVAAKAS